MRLLLFLLPAAGLLAEPLIKGRTLDGWEVRGDAIWTVNSDRVIVGQRRPVKEHPPEGTPAWRGWFYQQAWLFTRAEYENFDLHVEYWLPLHGNSGIGLRDVSRAEGGITLPSRGDRTSKAAYEIQLNNQYPDDHRSGSIYGLAKAPEGLQNDDDWNAIDIEARADKITVRINGKLAAEHAVMPERPKKGPIGLQLHDRNSLAMFRNIKITPRK